MGAEENRMFGPAAGRSAVFDTLLAELEAKQINEASIERRALADAAADRAALPALAEFYLPPDIREFGERHGIPQFAQAVWINAFIDGWRAAHRQQAWSPASDPPAPGEAA